ncbi:DCC1-like thiol-disulfide oxidoreductase family protein [Shewanella abyssi]|uniref:thiol-disulfide oxidoreductase DCC family protein n=1 Tax=Shewanella abyssi TaxID=311789 RepID=UPI00200E0C16|nr:DCC1-like thiol-disulfide oxidoreductase family protein [Shewanella abyssi]MCL1049692.1 DCC1-like thiol-disulfide oxidoreductase family protein [Shewanella abyssi]
MAQQQQKSQHHALVIFDGVCNLCHGTVNFIIKHDRRGYFVFAPFQSKIAQAYLSEHGVNDQAQNSVILIKADQCYLRSDAAIEIATSLDGAWSWLRFIRYLPKALRDGLYNQLAKRRYRMFGKRELCLMPNEALKSRFLVD